MKRIILLIIISIFVINCPIISSQFEKNFELSDGQEVKVILSEKEVSKDEKVLSIQYQIDKRILREETVEKHVLEIWKKLEIIANEKDIEEGIIKSRYFVGKDEKTNEPDYEEFLFVAEKIENGTWKIRKVN